MNFVMPIVICTLLVAPAVGAAQPALHPPPVRSNIRPVRGWIERVLREHVPRSPTLRRLVERVEGSSLMVHVTDAVRPLDTWDGSIQFVATAGHRRYVRIDLRPQALDARAAALLAHELQHAVEIDEGQVDDRAGFVRLFPRIGFAIADGARRVFDTEAAVAVGIQTLRELTGLDAKPSWRTSEALELARGSHQH